MNIIQNIIFSDTIITFIFVVIIIALAFYIYCNRRDLIQKAALYAVSVAEEEWGSGTGRIKFAEVYTYIKKEFPLFTLFFTETQLTLIIEDALDELKEILRINDLKESTWTSENQE
jgi:hypothetical protein